MSETNPFDEFRGQYYWEPVRFVQEVLGAEPDDWQKTFLGAIALGERQISIKSGHGVGKSTATAWAGIWHFFTRFPQKTVITGPSASQLHDGLMSELKGWIKKMPEVLSGIAEIKSDRIEFIPAPEESFISLRTARKESPEALAGIHSDHVMMIADEASGIDQEVFDASAGSMSGEHAHLILLGNPTKSSGFFYDTHHSKSGSWFTMTVSGVDSKRVKAAFIEDMRLRYGGEDTNGFRIRVLGEFPLGDDNTVVPMSLIQAALDRDIQETPNQKPIWGLDVARFGSDRTALCIRHGNVVRDKVLWWAGLDTMQTVGRVKAMYDTCSFEERPVEILVDVIGIGAGVVDRGREMGLPMRGINVSESPSLGDKYLNLRAELWFKAREWLEARNCKLPRDADLINELATIQYAFQSSGKIKIESKDEIKRRGVRSPDIADAFVLTFASDAATAGNAASYFWASNKPLRRNIPRCV